MAYDSPEVSFELAQTPLSAVSPAAPVTSKRIAKHGPVIWKKRRWTVQVLEQGKEPFDFPWAERSSGDSVGLAGKTPRKPG